MESIYMLVRINTVIPKRKSYVKLGNKRIVKGCPFFKKL